MCKVEGIFCQAQIKASLLTRLIMTLDGICPLEKASTSDVLAPAARVKCLVTTWASGYLAPKAVRNLSRYSCSNRGTLT